MLRRRGKTYCQRGEEKILSKRRGENIVKEERKKWSKRGGQILLERGGQNIVKEETKNIVKEERKNIVKEERKILLKEERKNC